MLGNPAIPYPASAPRQTRQHTLNDFRVRGYAAEPGPANSALNLSGFVLVSVVAMGAFVMLDPFGMFGPAEETTQSAASPVVVLQTEPPVPAMKEFVTPRLMAPAARSVEETATPAPVARAPIASATVAHATVVQAARVPATAVQRRAAASAPESRGKPSNEAVQPIVRAAPEEPAAPPAIVVKPEARADAPVIVNRVEEVKEAPMPEIMEAPKPAAASDQPAVVKEEAR